MTVACQSTSKVQGQTVILASIPSGGYAPYTVNFYKNNSLINSINNIQTNQQAIYSYQSTNSDTGNITFSADVIDSCPIGSLTSPRESCTITFSPPPTTPPPTTPPPTITPPPICIPQSGEICIPGIGAVKSSYIIAGGAIGIGLIALMLID